MIRYTPPIKNAATIGADGSIIITAAPYQIDLVPGDTVLFILLYEPVILSLLGAVLGSLVTIGTTPGGTEISDGIQIEDGFASLQQVIYFPSNTTIYFTGLDAGSKIILKK